MEYGWRAAMLRLAIDAMEAQPLHLKPQARNPEKIPLRPPLTRAEFWAGGSLRAS